MIPVKTLNRKCSVVDCGRKHFANSFCVLHHTRKENHGNINTNLHPHKFTVRLCSVEGCGDEHYGLGYCRAHHRRFKKHGDVNKVIIVPIEKKRTFLGKKHTEEFKQKLSLRTKGSKNPMWKGGISTIAQIVRLSDAYKQWRKLIIERDNYACVLCGKRGYLHVDHHPKSFAEIMRDNNIISLDQAMMCEELWDIKNNRTLCFECHTKTPNWGYRGHLNAHTT